MPRNFSFRGLWARLPKSKMALGKDPRLAVRLALGVLLAANVVAALLLFKPWGGSPEDMERQLGELRRQVQQRQVAVDRLRTLVAKVGKARAEGDTFMKEYFMDRQTASSTIVSELGQSAKEAGIKPREHTFVFEPIEGSDTLSMMTVSANYEGAYGDLVRFVNLLDRSPRFLILDQMQAAPQQAQGTLNVNFKLNTFVIEERPRP